GAHRRALGRVAVGTLTTLATALGMLRRTQRIATELSCTACTSLNYNDYGGTRLYFPFKLFLRRDQPSAAFVGLFAVSSPGCCSLC
ncbi:hypothetical protein FB107DRAFT_265491, partial [Schizophyllum commune]